MWFGLKTCGLALDWMRDMNDLV